MFSSPTPKSYFFLFVSEVRCGVHDVLNVLQAALHAACQVPSEVGRIPGHVEPHGRGTEGPPSRRPLRLVQGK